MGTNPQRSENADHNFNIPLQESSSSMVQNPNQLMDHTDVRHGIQSLSLLDEPRSHDILSNNSWNNPTPMEDEAYSQTSIHSQSDSHDGTSSTGLDVYDSSELCIRGISHNASASFPGHRFPSLVEEQRRRPFDAWGNPDAQNQYYHHSENSFSEPTRLQTVSQQQNRSDDLLSILGNVRSPSYADLTIRLCTFSKWPSDITQTPSKVAEAGFYYTGLQDIVRCFACGGSLKNWDPDDDPWIEHARWFPQCAYVRHMKGEEFINLVRMSTEESDEEDDYTVHRGATWQEAGNAYTNPDSEPSVLECKDAQVVMEMGFSEKDVAMAINDIFRTGKQEFTSQEILDIILEKEISGELSNYKMSANCSPFQENSSDTEQVISENKHLKALLQCTECKSKQRNILFLPCTHHIVCESCSPNLQICTKCYRKIKKRVRTYMVSSDCRK